MKGRTSTRWSERYSQSQRQIQSNDRSKMRQLKLYNRRSRIGPIPSCAVGQTCTTSLSIASHIKQPWSTTHAGGHSKHMTRAEESTLANETSYWGEIRNVIRHNFLIRTLRSWAWLRPWPPSLPSSSKSQLCSATRFRDPLSARKRMLSLRQMIPWRRSIHRINRWGLCRHKMKLHTIIDDRTWKHSNMISRTLRFKVLWKKCRRRPITCFRR